MNITSVRDKVLAFLAAVVVLIVVVAVLIGQEQMKDDCRASGGFVTEVHDGTNTWVCSQQGAAPVILNIHRGGRRR